MADFKISGHMKVKTLKELFANEIGGTLRVYNGKKLADDDATLASIRSNEGAKGGDFTCRTSRTVGKFEQEIWDVYGIKVQVATADNWILVLDGITLSKVKDIPNYATKESMEAFVSYKRKAKDEATAETQEESVSEASSNLKKFTIKISTKGAHEIAYAIINTDEYNIDDITLDDAWDMEMEYLAACAMGDEWEGHFELKVYNENNEIVYETDSYDDINKINLSDYTDLVENEEIEVDNELFEKVKNTLKERAEQDKQYMNVGDCVLLIREAKWRHMQYCIEDVEFDPEKLFLVFNPQLNGADYDYYTDGNHVLYKDEFLEDLEEDGGGDDYGDTYYIAERTNRYFEVIREIEE